MITNFLKDEEGATAVEYAIMAAAIAAVIVVVVFSIGVKTKDMYNLLDTKWKSQ